MSLSPLPFPLPHRRLAAIACAPLPLDAPDGPRGSLLEAALKQFAQKGFAGASVRDIAQAAGLKPASVYSHYRSKDEMLITLCELAHREQLRRTREALQNVGSDPALQITAYVRAHVVMHATHPMLCVISNSELHEIDPEAGKVVFDIRNNSIQLLLDIVERGIGSGQFDVNDSWQAAAAIGGMGVRVAYWYTVDFDKTPDEVADQYAIFALRLLGVDQGRISEDSAT